MVIYKNVEVPQAENLWTEFAARSFFHFLYYKPAIKLRFI